MYRKLTGIKRFLLILIVVSFALPAPAGPLNEYLLACQKKLSDLANSYRVSLLKIVSPEYAKLIIEAGNLADQSGVSVPDVIENLRIHAKINAPIQIRSRQEAKKAFSDNDAVLSSTDGAIAHVGRQWYYKNSIGNTEVLGKVPLDIKMPLADGHNYEVLEIMDKMATALASRDDASADEAVFFLNADVNGFKAVNNSVPTPSFQVGYHGTGDAVLNIIGETLSDLAKKSFIARTGGDEITGIISFRNSDEAKAFVGRINLVLNQRLESYLDEQLEALKNLRLEVLKAENPEGLPPLMRFDHFLSFDASKKYLMMQIEERLFRIKKDRPSLSISLGQIDQGLLNEANSLSLTPIELLKKETDSKMNLIKDQYKMANGLSTSRDGPLDWKMADKDWIPPSVSEPIVFKRK